MVAEEDALWVGEETRVEGGEIFFGDGFGVETVFWVETFFEGVIHGVDGGFAVVVTGHGIDVLFLEEKEDKEKGGKKDDNEEF